MKKPLFIYFLSLLIFVPVLAQDPSVSVFSGISKVYSFDLNFDIADLAIQEKGKNYALFVAVQDYKNDDIPDLKEPVADAEKLMRMLQTYYTFEAAQMQLIKNPTLRELSAKLQELSDKITENDNLLLFFAGHGEWDANIGTGYWLPSDARKNEKSGWLSNSSLREYIRAIKCKHVLLVTDACFSGSLFRSTKSLTTATTAISQLYELSSRKAMTSGALKVVPDKSVFMEYLVRRLGQNPSKFLPAERLFHSFKQDVIAGSLGQIPQYGNIQDAGPNEGGDFIFVRRK